MPDGSGQLRGTDDMTGAYVPIGCAVLAACVVGCVVLFVVGCLLFVVIAAAIG